MLMFVLIVVVMVMLMLMAGDDDRDGHGMDIVLTDDHLLEECRCSSTANFG